MPLSQAFMQSIENGDPLAWTALIALSAECLILALIAVSLARRM